MNLEQSILDAKSNIHQPHVLGGFFFSSLLIMSINYANLGKNPTEYVAEGGSSQEHFSISLTTNSNWPKSVVGGKMVFLVLKYKFYRKKFLATWTIYIPGNALRKQKSRELEDKTGGKVAYNQKQAYTLIGTTEILKRHKQKKNPTLGIKWIVKQYMYSIIGLIFTA